MKEQIDVSNAGDTEHAILPPGSDPPPAKLHRLRAARMQERISRANIARRLNVSVEEVYRQEQETTDLPLSVLYQWQEILGVPLAELLAEPEDGLPVALRERARLVRIMKTVLSIFDAASQPRVKRLAQMLIEQLHAIMPELRGIKHWPVVGKRRRLDELGRAVRHFFRTTRAPTHDDEGL